MQPLHTELNWKKLYFGHVSPQEVQEAVNDECWQMLREGMKGKSLEEKYRALDNYWYFASLAARDAHEQRMINVRVTNYITALSRGRLIKPEDYKR